MTKNTLNSLMVLVFALLIAACKSKKAVVAPPQASASTNAKITSSRSQTIHTLIENDFVYNTLVLKGKAALSVDNDENDVTLNIRIKKNQTIWVSVSALGGVFEVARVRITPDSLFLLNRMKKTFAKKPFSYLYDFTNPQVTFGLLQAILSGNTYALFLNDPAKLSQENNLWVASGTKDNLAFQCVFSVLLKPSELSLNDPKESQSLRVSYPQYTKTNQGMFPLGLKISSQVETKKIAVDITFTKIEANIPLEFPFSVPKNFQLIK